MTLKKEKYDIFISYRREDGAVFAESVANNLQLQGYRVFFDKKELKIGNDFPYELQKAIKESKEFICIVTESYFGMGKAGVRIYNNDDWIHNELLLAIRNEKTNIFPVLVGTVPPTGEQLPEDINDVCMLNFYTYNNQYDTIEKLVDVLKQEFHEETIEHAATGRVLHELDGVDIHNNREFNIVCKKIITLLNTEKEVNALNHILEYKADNAFYYDDDYRFVAFYTLFSYYRRMHFLDKLIELVERYLKMFDGYDFFFYVMVEYYTLKFQLAQNKESETVYLTNMVKYAEMANARIENNNGITHSFCISIALACENGINISDSELEKAIFMIDSIIAKDKMYARYYSTKARLLACACKFDAALKCIRYAQSIERPEFNDWMLRIAGYYRDECNIRCKQIEYNNKLKNI